MRASQVTLLLVDDDDLTLQALQRSLDLEATIETTTSGSAAARLAKQKKYAVVLTDLVMPGMNGMELIETLRIHSPDTVCVVLSGRMDNPYPNGLPPNVMSYLHKPCPMTEIIRALDAALAEYFLRTSRAAGSR